MTGWMYGVGLVVMILIVAILKSDTQTRIVLVGLAIGAALFLRPGRRKR